MDNWGWKFCLFASILGLSIELFRADWISLIFSALWWSLALSDFQLIYKEKINAVHKKHSN